MSPGFGTRAASLVLGGCLLASCETTTTHGTDVAVGSAPTSNAALAKQLGISCKNAAAGEGCIQGNLDVGDYYDIILSPSCERNGQFANVIGKTDVELLDKLPVTASHAKVIGYAEKGQLLCIQATAHVNQHISYYYVVDISKRTQACRGWALADELRVLLSKP